MKKLATLLLALLLFTTTVYASSAIQAVLSDDISVKLNGSTLTLKDANGNPVYPISYNGTTYLPVRAVAENLDLDVKWDGNTKTVELSKKSAPQKDTYGLNEWWVVDGLWKLKINSVTVTKKANNVSDSLKEVLIIDYTYENLGYDIFEGQLIETLIMEPRAVMDTNKKVGEKILFSNIDRISYPKETPVGAINEHVQVIYGVPSDNNNTVSIYFAQYGKGFSERYNATFNVPVSR